MTKNGTKKSEKNIFDRALESGESLGGELKKKKAVRNWG